VNASKELPPFWAFCTSAQIATYPSLPKTKQKPRFGSSGTNGHKGACAHKTSKNQ